MEVARKDGFAIRPEVAREKRRCSRSEFFFCRFLEVEACWRWWLWRIRGGFAATMMVTRVTATGSSLRLSGIDDVAGGGTIAARCQKRWTLLY
ncbi:hypothetical protein LR48_Vigan04g026900 [Vigna angularis]|uniref:Uncharacterized protein n=1 Tax=Phaseolus angularis TaxID=3914 RepID=A0A0L9UBL2_PHAAN|nr:hypothetical protein LR48_Vigan04g026900 [Vigna angularis]